MHTLNHELEESVLEADGRYLDTQELHSLELYLKSYDKRLETYEILREKHNEVVLQALRKLAQVHPEVIQKHGKRCKYDMSEVLRYIALSILRNDEIFFKEAMMTWLDTILVAHHRHTQCIKAYQYLQEVVDKALPPADANLVRPYIDIVIMTLKTHA
jgi:hypothetical protein